MKRALLLILLTAVAGGASAVTFVVTKESDDNGACTPDDCALREAVLAANALPGADTVEIPPGAYQLSIAGAGENFAQTGDIDILYDLVLRGAGARVVTVIGDGSDRVLEVNPAGGTVEISGLTVTGGAIAESGGGIRVTGPNSLTLRQLSILNNTSMLGDGGGLFIGAIDLVQLEDLTIAENSAPASRGGGAYISAASVSDFVDVTNVTISGNSAFAGGGITLFGSGFIDLFNVTVANNTAPIVSGIFGDTSVRLSYFNVLVVNNDCGYIQAIPMSNAHSMESPGDTCFVPGQGDSTGVPDVFLGPLAYNGGETMTHALGVGSPAIDAGENADCPATDQRGVPRPQDGDRNGTSLCDIGAFEMARFNAVTDVPAVGSLGIATLAALLAVSALGMIRRARRVRCNC